MSDMLMCICVTQEMKSSVSLSFINLVSLTEKKLNFLCFPVHITGTSFVFPTHCIAEILQTWNCLKEKMNLSKKNFATLSHGL